MSWIYLKSKFDEIHLINSEHISEFRLDDDTIFIFMTHDRVLNFSFENFEIAEAKLLELCKQVGGDYTTT